MSIRDEFQPKPRKTDKCRRASTLNSNQSTAVYSSLWSRPIPRITDKVYRLVQDYHIIIISYHI